jgi:hypothetical protein
MLAINNWDKEYERVLLGGLTCDSDDFYNSIQNTNDIYLPMYEKDSPQYIGFFHTGAYQESIGGFGGIQHCLTPAPKHVVISKNDNDEVKYKLFAKEQDYKGMLDILGYDKYVFINVGYNGLTNIPGTNVTGTYPIPVSTFAYYEIRDNSTVVGAGSQTVFVKRINVVCEPRFDVISLYYLSKAGSFEVLHFTKLSERTSQVSSEGYSQYPYTALGGVIKYDESVSVDRTLSVAERKRIKVNSDWVTTEEIKRYKDIATSPLVYIDQADGYGFVSVKVLPQTYKEQKKYNEKLTSLSFDLEFTHQNWRQRG